MTKEEIKEKLCSKPKNCGGAKELSQGRGRASKCKEALGVLTELIKDRREKQERRERIIAEIKGIDEGLLDLAISGDEEAEWCDDCVERRLKRIKEIVDPAPSGWETLGKCCWHLGCGRFGLLRSQGGK